MAGSALKCYQLQKAHPTCGEASRPHPLSNRCARPLVSDQVSVAFQFWEYQGRSSAMRCALRYFGVGLVHTWEAPPARLQVFERQGRRRQVWRCTSLAMHSSTGPSKKPQHPEKVQSTAHGRSVVRLVDRSVGVPVDRSAGSAVGRRCRRSVAHRSVVGKGRSVGA